MSIHTSVHAGTGQTVTSRPEVPAHPLLQFLARAAGVIVAWALAAGGMSLLWQRGFDFPANEAWPLAIGLVSMFSLLITTLLLANYALSRDV